MAKSRPRTKTSKQQGDDSPDQPIVVIAPQHTPKAVGAKGRGGPLASDGDVSSSASPPKRNRRHPSSTSGAYEVDEDEEPEFPPPPPKTMSGELVGQLRAELRRREEPQSDVRRGSPSPAALRAAALARLPTPPMDTTEPLSPSHRALGPITGQHPAKRAHAPPRGSPGVDIALPAALRPAGAPGKEKRSGR